MPQNVDFRALKWLYEQLPLLANENIISSETADKIRSHYGELPPPRMGVRGILQIIFGILGVALVAGGIILIIAHNWDELPRWVRVILSFAPIIIAQLLSAYALCKRRDSEIWMESTAFFQALMVGSSISLVSQTYHIYGDLPSFLLTWLLLTLPLIYVHRSTTAALLYICLIVGWALNINPWKFGSQYKNVIWLSKLAALYACLIPHWCQVWKKDALSWKNILVGWFAGIGLIWSYQQLLRGNYNISYAIFYGATLALMYALDKYLTRSWPNPFKRPLYFIGCAGTLIYIFAESFKYGENYHPLGIHQTAFYVSALLALAAISLSFLSWKAKGLVNYTLAAFPLVILLSQFITPIYAQALINFYGVVLGVACILRGLGSSRWTVTNAGILMIAALMMARFFSDDFSLIAKGLVFILIGIGFLSVNYMQWRKSQAEVV